MKYLSIILIASLALIVSCNTPQRYYKKGNYDMAVRKSVEKLRKKPTNEKVIAILVQSYENAKRLDYEKIKYLKQENKPDSWFQIFNTFSRLKERQTLVSTITPIKSSRGIVQFEYIDYDTEIINAKQNAAEYFYKRGNNLLKKNNRFDARTAYDDFVQVKNFYFDYANIDNLIAQAKIKGMTYAKISVDDYTIFKLPQTFKNYLIPEDLSRLNSQWVEYHGPNSKINPHYNVEVMIQRIILSPREEKEKAYVVSKEVEDGWQYVLDTNGNVLKDSLGNDIKVTKYKTLTCHVKEYLQRREVNVQGLLTYRDLERNLVVRQVNLASGANFENVYATANGDISILDKETKALLNSKPAVIPMELDMILMAGEHLKESIRSALLGNRSYVK